MQNIFSRICTLAIVPLLFIIVAVYSYKLRSADNSYEHILLNTFNLKWVVQEDIEPKRSSLFPAEVQECLMIMYSKHEMNLYNMLTDQKCNMDGIESLMMPPQDSEILQELDEQQKKGVEERRQQAEKNQKQAQKVIANIHAAKDTSPILGVISAMLDQLDKPTGISTSDQDKINSIMENERGQDLAQLNLNAPDRFVILFFKIDHTPYSIAAFYNDCNALDIYITPSTKALWKDYYTKFFDGIKHKIFTKATLETSSYSELAVLKIFQRLDSFEDLSFVQSSIANNS